MDNRRKYYHPDLSDAQVSILKFLRQEVDRCAEDDRKFDRDENSQQRLWYARDALARYVETLRTMGKQL